MTAPAPAPCRNCESITQQHCKGVGSECTWWVCSHCGAYGSDVKRRMVVPQGRGRERGEDGISRTVRMYDIVDYDAE